MSLENTTINIAIFGLSLRMLHELKERTLGIVDGKVTINWTNIVEPNLDVLMINECFYNAPNIQRLLKANDIQVLKLSKSPVSASDTLVLPLDNNNTSLLEWIQANILQRDGFKSSVMQSAVVESISIPSVFTELQSNSYGVIKMFDSHGLIACADTRLGWAWLNDAHVLRPRDSGLNFTHAIAQELSEQQANPMYEFNNWLWNVVWCSESFRQKFSTDAFYQLTTWPQPLSTTDRRAVLRMAACFAKGANLYTVAKHLDLEVSVVRQFITACAAVNYIVEIPRHKAGFSTQNRYGIDSNAVLLSVFSKIRRKLGL